MSRRPRTWKLALASVATWLATQVVLIVGHGVNVLVYSTMVAPGLSPAEYSEYAERSGPLYVILAGGPVFYLAAVLLRRRLGSSARVVGLAAWGLYCLGDLAILAAMGRLEAAFLLGAWLLAQAVKLVAVLLATRKT